MDLVCARDSGLAETAETGVSAGESTPGFSEATAAPSGQVQTRNCGCSADYLGSPGTGLKRVTTDLDLEVVGKETVRKAAIPDLKTTEEPNWQRNRGLELFSFRNNEYRSLSCYKTITKQTKKGHSQAFIFFTCSGKALYCTDRSISQRAVQLPAITTLSLLFLQKCSSNCSLNGL